MDKTNYLYWSFHTGEFYNVLEDEVDALDAFQLRMLKRADSNCKKCYGRFHEGKNVATGLYIPCHKCGKKSIDFETLNPNAEPIDVSNF
jgi:hypothetical protein